MNLDYLIFIALALNTILSVGIFLRNPKSKANQLYAVFVTLLDAWIVMNFLENEPGIVGLKNLELFLRLDFVFAMFFFYAWFKFCVVFVNSKLAHPKYKWISNGFLMITILFAPLSLFTSTIIKNIEFYDGVIHFEDGVVWPIYALFILLGQLGGLIILFLGRKRTKSEGHMLKRRQIGFVFYGFLVSFTISTVINLFLQTFFPISLELSRFALYGMTFMVVSTAYAMVKQRLFELKFIIVRAIGFLFFTVIIAAVYASIFFLGLAFLSGFSVSANTIVIGIVLTVIAALSFQPLYRRIAKLTNKLFFKGSYVPEHLLSKLTRIMAENINFGSMTKKVLDVLVKEICIAKAAFVIIEERKTVNIRGVGYKGHEHVMIKLEPILRDIYKNRIKNHNPVIFEELGEGRVKEIFRALDISIVIPIRIEKKEMVILILGPKLSGEMYYQKDLDLLAIFALEAGIAIQNTKAYAEIKKFSEELEQRVTERTAEIQRLQEEQKQMMVDISHGLQTPLTVARGELDFLKKREPDNKHLDAFGRSIEDVSKFIYDLLDLAKLETSQDDFKKEPVNFSQLLHELVEYFGVLAEEDGIALESNIEPNIVIHGDKSKLKELVTNLVSNSFKYMPDKNEKKVSITLYKADDEKTELVVEDTGRGISKEDLPNIFKRFYRVGKRDRTDMKGTGLGLAITKRIVEKHNGTIDVESEKGVGTKFTVIFRK